MSPPRPDPSWLAAVLIPLFAFVGTSMVVQSRRARPAMRVFAWAWTLSMVSAFSAVLLVFLFSGRRSPGEAAAFGAAVLAGGLFAAGQARRRGEEHLGRCEGPETLFLETMVSGRSFAAWYSRFGGVNNALAVAVTRRSLSIHPISPFDLLLKPLGTALDQDLPLDRIVSVVRVRSFWRDEVVVEYLDGAGGKGKLGLWVSRPEELIEGLRPSGSRPGR